MSTVWNRLVDLTKSVFGILPSANGGTGVASTATFPTSGVVTTNDATSTLQNKTINNTNTVQVLDANFTVQDDVDSTRRFKFDATAVSPSTTRTYGVPNADTTLVGTNVSQTLTNKLIDGATNTLSNIPLTSVTGTLGVANGGTGSTSFTTGAVPFSNGTILTQDASNLVFDDTNNRLGIGTATPSTTLDVRGTIHTQAADTVPQLSINTNAGVEKANYHWDGAAINFVGASAPLQMYGWSSIYSFNPFYMLSGVQVNRGSAATTADFGGSDYATAGTPLTTTNFKLNSWAWNGSNGFSLTTPARIQLTQLTAANDSARLDFQIKETSPINALSILSSGNVGVSTTTPTSLFSVGSSSPFQVDTSGNVVKLNNVTTSFPASQGAADRYLRNDGSGNLSWAATSLTAGVTGTLPIANGGSGQTTANAALNAFLPSQTSNSGKALITNGTNASWTSITATTPTQQTFTSGSGTYTTPANVAWIRVRMVGGGAGGAGGNQASAGTAGGNTTFGSSLLTANGGASSNGGSSSIGTGGSASIGGGASGLAISGGQGQSGYVNASGAQGIGGIGGSSAFGGAGSGNASTSTAGSAATNSGAGGGGGGMGTSSGTVGNGGGAGGFIDAIISAPSATYSYAVGAGGAGASAGSGGGAGGAGAAGIIIVEEHYI